MVLIGDIVGETTTRWSARRERGRPPANLRGAEGFVAVSAESRRKFWLDRAPPRSRRHTNAFKINEDVVIPLPRLGDYTDGVERINVELSLGNKLRARRRARAVRASRRAHPGGPRTRVRPPQAGRSTSVAAARLQPARRCAARWQVPADRIDETFPALREPDATVVRGRTELRAPLEDLFDGLAFAPVVAAIRRRTRGLRKPRSSRCTCTPATATSTNIPVNLRTTTGCCAR